MKTVSDIVLELKSEFSADVLDENLCRDWFLKKLHPDGVYCPQCGLPVTGEKKLGRFWTLDRIQCSEGTCRKSFSALTGTSLNGLGISFRVLYILLFMTACGMNVNRIAPQLGISVGTAYIWANKAKSQKGLANA
jgi:Transposase and inactivated derivatives